MSGLANILIGFIAIEHAGVLFLEMFLWRKPIGLRIFQMTQNVADASAVLAANQGLYNGFLAAGLAWSLFMPSAEQALAVKTFFLGCIVVAGVYGGFTANPRIWALQAAPALIALALSRY
jgi:putative membrane protein